MEISLVFVIQCIVFNIEFLATMWDLVLAKAFNYIIVGWASYKVDLGSFCSSRSSGKLGFGKGVVSMVLLGPTCYPIVWTTGESRDSIPTPVVQSMVMLSCSVVVDTANTVGVIPFTICVIPTDALASGELASGEVFCHYHIGVSSYYQSSLLPSMQTSLSSTYDFSWNKGKALYQNKS